MSTATHISETETVQKCSDLVFDVGLHLGEDIDFYLRKGFRVVAIEADPELCKLCRRRFMREIDSGQLVLIEGAIQQDPAFAEETVRFYKNQNSVWGTTRRDWSERNSRLGATSVMIEVPVVNFSRIIREYGIPRYMKIDIEGCDMTCILALKKFRLCPDFISIESDKTSLAGIRLEIDALAELGYESFMAIEQSMIPALQSPPIPAREGRDASYVFPERSSGLFGLELPGPWLSRRQIIDRYRFIRLGYFLLGDDGIMNCWRFRGSGRLRQYAANVLRRFTKAAVPGWYDTHARHSSVTDR